MCNISVTFLKQPISVRILKKVRKRDGEKKGRRKFLIFEKKGHSYILKILRKKIDRIFFWYSLYKYLFYSPEMLPATIISASTFIRRKTIRRFLCRYALREVWRMKWSFCFPHVTRYMRRWLTTPTVFALYCNVLSDSFP